MEVGQTVERDSLAARTRDGTREGFILPIGGAEEKIGVTRILSRLVDLLLFGMTGMAAESLLPGHFLRIPGSGPPLHCWVSD